MNEYAHNYEFYVDFWNPKKGSNDSAHFARISNLQSKIEYEVIHEGGNAQPVLLPTPSKQPETITFERGVALNTSSGFWDSLRPGMMVENVVIFVQQYRTTIRKLRFDQGIVISKEYPLLNAISGEVYIEKLQIAHSGLVEYFVPYKQG